MDGLSDEQRIEAWKSCWEKSFVGMAIVQEDGTFLAVNQQWVKMLGVPATEFYGNTFQDITPRSEVVEDEEQAKLVAEGLIDSYEMDKSYEFVNGKKTKIRLLVTRVPINTAKPFMFFLARIVLRKEANASDATNSAMTALSQSQSSTSHQPESKHGNDFWAQVIGFVVRYWVAIAVGSAASVGLIAGIFNEFFQMGWF